jgi:ABC-type nitrate/sulfonate/bicarbonate transport system ATPase subunit
MLLDEPFGALDAITRSQMQHWLLSMASNLKTTIIFITHDIEEAILLSNRIYVLSDKPAAIKDEVLVELPELRTRDIITSLKFNEIKKRIINNLMYD